MLDNQHIGFIGGGAMAEATGPRHIEGRSGGAGANHGSRRFCRTVAAFGGNLQRSRV